MYQLLFVTWSNRTTYARIYSRDTLLPTAEDYTLIIGGNPKKNNLIINDMLTYFCLSAIGGCTVLAKVKGNK